MNCITATWYRIDALNKCMIIRFIPHQNTTLPKWMFSQNFYLQLILATKWPVRHSITPPNQQRRPLPSRLCLILLHCPVSAQWPARGRSARAPPPASSTPPTYTIPPPRTISRFRDFTSFLSTVLANLCNLCLKQYVRFKNNISSSRGVSTVHV